MPFYIEVSVLRFFKKKKINKIKLILKREKIKSLQEESEKSAF